MRAMRATGAFPAYRSGIHPGQITADHTQHSLALTATVSIQANLSGFGQ